MMRPYHILEDFKGSQDGRFTEEFKAGTVADLSDYLVSCLPAGAVKPVESAPSAPAASAGEGVAIQRRARKQKTATE